MRKAPVLALLGSALAVGQVYAPGPQVTTFLSDVDDSDQPYGLYLPRNFDPAKKYPLVISLHGAWSNHRLNLRRVFGKGNRPGESDAEATRRFPALADVDFIVASPLARGTMGYQGIAERDVYDVLADVKRRFPIDEDRIYLTGLSMGGGGTLLLGLTRPDLWAAIAPVCPAAPNGIEALAGNALNLPVKIFQGSIDPVVRAESSREWQKRFVDAGVKSEYVEYPGVRHNSWDNAYKDAAIFEWFRQFRRNPFPERVRYTSADYAHGSAYWVRFDVLTPGEPASIDARFEDRNKLRIETSHLDAFTLSLKGHPMFAPAQMLTVVVDGATLRTRAQRPLSLSRSGGKWTLKPAAPEPSQKRPGAEGPIAQAIACRHIYVYGTGGSPSAEELLRRREQAASAAEWSTPSSRLLLSFHVLADKDVKDSDLEGANVVLFGTKETNTLLAKIAPRLPISLNPGAADYGLVYVYPLDGRYVVVSSGLPWWTRIDQVPASGFSFTRPAVRALTSFGDYVLFKGGIDHIITGGRFDQDWKLPGGATAALQATGAVEVRP